MVAIVFALAIAALLGLQALGRSGAFQAPALFRPLAAALAIAVPLGVSAWLFDVRRMLLYAVVIVVACATGRPIVGFGIAAAVIVASGVVVMLAFRRRTRSHSTERRRVARSPAARDIAWSDIDRLVHEPARLMIVSRPILGVLNLSRQPASTSHATLPTRRSRILQGDPLSQSRCAFERSSGELILRVLRVREAVVVIGPCSE